MNQEIKKAIELLVSFEPTMTQKLDFLTAITVETGNDDTWEASEAVRSDVVDWEKCCHENS